MQTIFEIFDPVTGKTEGYRHGRRVARSLIDRLENYGHIRDYLPAAREGFYVVDMRDFVKDGPFADRTAAQNKADFENLANDYNSFTVVEHTLD
jgi:hypothetical protein